VGFGAAGTQWKGGLSLCRGDRFARATMGRDVVAAHVRIKNHPSAVRCSRSENGIYCADERYRLNREGEAPSGRETEKAHRHDRIMTSSLWLLSHGANWVQPTARGRLSLSSATEGCHLDPLIDGKGKAPQLVDRYGRPYRSCMRVFPFPRPSYPRIAELIVAIAAITVQHREVEGLKFALRSGQVALIAAMSDRSARSAAIAQGSAASMCVPARRPKRHLPKETPSRVSLEEMRREYQRAKDSWAAAMNRSDSLHALEPDSVRLKDDRAALDRLALDEPLAEPEDMGTLHDPGFRLRMILEARLREDGRLAANNSKATK